MSNIDFFTSGCFQVVNCRVNQELKMLNSKWTTMNKMKSRNVVVITNVWLEGMQEFLSLYKRNWRDLLASLGYFFYEIIVKFYRFTFFTIFRLRFHCFEGIDFVKKPSATSSPTKVSSPTFSSLILDNCGDFIDRRWLKALLGLVRISSVLEEESAAREA